MANGTKASTQEMRMADLSEFENVSQAQKD